MILADGCEVSEFDAVCVLFVIVVSISSDLILRRM